MNEQMYECFFCEKITDKPTCSPACKNKLKWFIEKFENILNNLKEDLELCTNY